MVRLEETEEGFRITEIALTVTWQGRHAHRRRLLSPPHRPGETHLPGVPGPGRDDNHPGADEGGEADVAHRYVDVTANRQSSRAGPSRARAHRGLTASHLPDRDACTTITYRGHGSRSGEHRGVLSVRAAPAAARLVLDGTAEEFGTRRARILTSGRGRATGWMATPRTSGGSSAVRITDPDLAVEVRRAPHGLGAGTTSRIGQATAWSASTAILADPSDRLPLRARTSSATCRPARPAPLHYHQAIKRGHLRLAGQNGILHIDGERNPLLPRAPASTCRHAPCTRWRTPATCRSARSQCS